jgi:hypothetical protein
VPLTATPGEKWSSDPYLSFDGRFSVAVCRAHRRDLTEADLRALHSELTGIVQDYHFYLAAICAKPKNPEEQQRFEALYRDTRLQLIDRLDAKAGGRQLIRGFDCAFGWTHYGDAGEPVSGVR